METGSPASTLVAILVPAVVGVGCTYLAIRYFEFYGMTLFLGVPFVVSFASAFLYRRSVRASWNDAYGMSVLSLFATAAMILVFALDGLGCLLMALPLGLVIALPGSGIGYLLAKPSAAQSSAAAGLVPFLFLPFLMGFERQAAPPTPLRSVVSAVVVDAPIDAVWDGVIAFDRITAPPRGIFRMGIAYPVAATIEGEGVGALRRCSFSTGDFVEPITTWEEPNLLAFDVVSNPPPMKELSIYPDLDVPHLHDTFVATRGRFRLRPDGERTILEGTTWYTQKLYPDWYWRRISDWIVHRIHLRVLEHIASEAERAAPHDGGGATSF